MNSFPHSSVSLRVALPAMNIPLLASLRRAASKVPAFIAACAGALFIAGCAAPPAAPPSGGMSLPRAADLVLDEVL